MIGTVYAEKEVYMRVNPLYPHMHKLLVSLPQTPSLVYRRRHSPLAHTSYKLTGVVQSEAPGYAFRK